MRRFGLGEHVKYIVSDLIWFFFTIHMQEN